MKVPHKLLASALLISSALSSESWAQTPQTYNYPSSYSIWNPLDSRINYSQFAAIVTAGDVEISRIVVPSILQSSFTLKFPAPLVDVTIAKLKTGFTGNGSTAGRPDLVVGGAEVYTLSTPFTIPAGGVTTIAYNPITTSIVVTVIPPLPALIPGISPVGSTAILGQSLIDAQGTWSFSTTLGSGGNAILLNGIAIGGSGVKLVVSLVGMKVLNNANQWWLWSGSQWLPSTAP